MKTRLFQEGGNERRKKVKKKKEKKKGWWVGGGGGGGGGERERERDACEYIKLWTVFQTNVAGNLCEQGQSK